MLQTLNLPVEQVTSCAFGGEVLDELYVTSASERFDERKWKEQPLAGSLLKVKMEVRGIPAFAYRG